MNKRTKSIIKAIANMDSVLLAELLEDGQPYAGVSKETFLFKMEQVFHQFQFDEQKRLKKIEGVYTPPRVLSTAPPLPAVGFFGAKAIGYIVLVFEEKSKEYTHIFECEPGELSAPSWEHISDHNDSWGLSIYEDERIDFVPPTENFHELSERCKEICDALFDDPALIDGKFMEDWWAQYGNFLPEFYEDDDVCFKYKQINRFDCISGNIYRYLTILDYNRHADYFNNKYKNAKSPLDRYRWLYKNRDFLAKIHRDFPRQFDRRWKETWIGKYDECYRSFKHKLDFTEFKTLATLKQLIEDTYFQMIRNLPTIWKSSYWSISSNNIESVYKQMYRTHFAGNVVQVMYGEQ